MKVLGIESSCDETAIAIVDSDKAIHANVILSQIDVHQPYGGVVPEIAAREHIKAIDHLIERAMQDAGLSSFKELDGIAVTAGPGLIGGVIVGVMAAKGIASVTGLPIVAVNHLEGHALTARLTDDIPFPFMLLLVSGGHCLVMAVEGVGQYHRLGSTIDDALGEAFDKVAKMLGLPYPGGPQVEKLAQEGNAKRFRFPRSLKGREGCDFSFSGLKTAVKREVDALGDINDQDKKDICASFQACVADILKDRIEHAIEMYRSRFSGDTLVVAGGVAANQFLRGVLEEVANAHHMQLKAPPLKLCTDNGAMIAWAGIERLNAGLADDLSFTPKARWPLDTL